MGAVGSLVRTFPGCASKVPLATMREEAFVQSLAFTLAKMSTQAAPGFQPQVRKTGQLLDEYRDTTNPGLVTDWFIIYIAALGVLTETARIPKNTREEVLWRDCLQPWRQIPLWLLVRVVLQLLLDISTCLCPSSTIICTRFLLEAAALAERTSSPMKTFRRTHLIDSKQS
jgi:hypothetical protein